MTWFHPHQVTRRADASRLVVVFIFLVLSVAFFRIQILGAHRYQPQSESNRLRPIPLPAPRGLIVDRNGVVLAENVPGYTVALVPSDADSLRNTLNRIAPIADLDSARIEAIIRRHRREPHQPVTVLRDAPFPLVSALEESRVTLKGLIIQTEPKRSYPYKDTVAHVLGYVGEVTEDELAAEEFPRARIGTIVGRDGLERQYDERLRGADGQRYIEVDALGRTVNDLDRSTWQKPRQGDTLRTTIDIGLQSFVASVFPGGWRGGVVAMNPKTGEVLALYSSPSYDPDAFVGGMDPDAWRVLSHAADHPLFNRAVEGRYAPASPFKLAVAASGLSRGIVTLDSHMEVPCQGGMLYGNRYFRCWREDGHGELTLREAIYQSCDVYFYQLGLQLSLSNLLSDGVRMGFSRPAGIDLPDERTPVFPESIEYYNRRYGPRGWTSGVTLNLAIGQGEHSQSVINMVKFYAKLANEDGSVRDPYLVAGNEGEESSLGLSRVDLAGLREALEMVVDSGTAVGARVSQLRIAGKTGTAQNPQGLPHGWFIGFAPAEDPEIVVGAIVEFAEHGSSVAPIVTNVIQRYLIGSEIGPSRLIEYLLPSDSAPEPTPLLPDTSLMRRTPSEAGAGGATQPQ